MDFRLINLDRVSFDDPTLRRRSLRYGGERAIRVQTPRVSVTVSTHPWGKRLSLRSCAFDDFTKFLKHVEMVGGGDWVDPGTNPLEHVFVSEDALLFDEHGLFIEDTTDSLPAGATLLVSCIVALDGVLLTRDTKERIISARLSVRLEQLKIHATTTPSKPAVYVNGVMLREREHERIADAGTGQ